MQVGPTSGLSQPLQALEGAAQNKYQAEGDFSFALDAAIAGQGVSPTAGGAAAGPALSGSFRSQTVYAVGTFGPDGQINMFSQQQIDQEQAALADVRKQTYGDALQNFLTLAQAASPGGGPVQGASITDQQQFVGDNGLIGANLTTHFDLQPGTQDG